jgi:putative ABC transport system permease protein
MLKNYLKIAWKVLLRRKFFTFISLFGISFTLMILVVITALADHIFSAKTPETNLDRMVMVTFLKTKLEDGGNRSGPLNYDFLNKYVKTLKTPENVSIHSTFTEVNAFVNNKKLELDKKFTDENFWQINDFKFIEGNGYNRNDLDRANMVAVINHDTKNEYFGSSPATGKMITVDGKNYKVIGVVENVPVTRFLSYADVYVPVTTAPEKLKAGENFHGEFMALILSKNKADIPIIKEEYQKAMVEVNNQSKVTNNIHYSFAENLPETFSRTFLGDNDKNNLGFLILILIFLMFLFMSLPAINLININISRIMERSSEIGVRKAFGATKSTLIGQFLVENIFLTLMGSFLGFIISIGVLKLINNSGIIQFANFTINYTVLIYGIVIALIFGILSGVYPAYKMSRLQAVEALKGGAL